MPIQSSRLLDATGRPAVYPTTDEANVTNTAWGTTKCLQFGGSSIYINYGLVYNYEYTEPFTISMWYKSSGSGVIQEVAGNFGAPTTFSGWGFRILSSGVLELFMANDLMDNTKRLIVNGSIAVTTGNWIMISASNNGAGLLSVYTNGIVDPAPSRAGTIATTTKNSNPFLVGTGVGLPTNYVQGRICEVVMTNIALSEDQLLGMYGVGKPQDPRKFIKSTNISGYWRFGTDDTYPVARANMGIYNGVMTGMSAASIVTDAP